MSPKLEAALRKWLKEPLTNHGLCMAVELEELEQELSNMFIKDGLNDMLPFNPGISNYYAEQLANVCHLNPKRIAWVKQKLGVKDESTTQRNA